MRGRRWASRCAAGLIGLCITAACSSNSEPEAELRQRIEAAVTAAEARDTGFFRDLIAGRYRDQRGNDRQGILNLLRGQFLMHQRIGVISRIVQVSLLSEDAAETVIVAGIIGGTGQSLGLQDMRADLYRIELEWARDAGDWRVIGARWSRGAQP